MPITNETINEFDLDRAYLMLRLHAVMKRMRRVVPRDGALRVPDFETRVERHGVRYTLGAYLTRDGDTYYVELCRDRHAHGDARVLAYDARVVVASRGSWRVGLDLLPLETACWGVDLAVLHRLQSALERVFGVAGEAASYLPDAPESSIRATLAGEG